MTRTCQVTLPQSGRSRPVTLELAATDDGSVVGSLCRTAETTDPFQYLFDLIQDAVVGFEIVNFVPIVRTVNPAFVDTFGYDREEIVGEPSTSTRSRRPLEQAVNYDQRTASGESTTPSSPGKQPTAAASSSRGRSHETADDRRCGYAVCGVKTAGRKGGHRLPQRDAAHISGTNAPSCSGCPNTPAPTQPVGCLAAASRALDAADRLAAVERESRGVVTDGN